MSGRATAAIESPHPIATSRRAAPTFRCMPRAIGASALDRRTTSTLWPIAVAALLALSAAPSIARAQTVDAVVASHRGGCTTAGVEGLSEQLVRTHLCMFPGAVTRFAPHAGITLTSSRVHPLSSVQTRDALHAAAARGPLQITSAFRTLVQQYLLHHEGGCGLAAAPGSSNHQSGVAVDLSNYSAALTRMRGAGCTHPYPSSDPVHFDCPGPDMRSASVRVFQHLWNVNNPGDPIAEDGAYGPQTGSRLGRSPAGGFPMDGCVVEPPRTWGAAFVAQSFPVAADPPIVMRPGEELAGYIELRNTGTETWNESTRLAPTQPRDRTSDFAGPDWMSGSRVASVGGTVPRDGTWRFEFTLRAPDMLGEHNEFFGVVQEGVTWFSDPGQLGPPDDQLQIRILVVEPDPMLDAGVSTSDAAVSDTDAEVAASDGGVRRRDAGDGGVEISGGCSCRAAGSSGSGRSSALMLLLALTLVLRARRRSAGRARERGVSA